MLPDRPSRDHIFMRIAVEFSLRSTCERGQVGALIVKDGHIIAHGYNGAPPGQPHCTQIGCDVHWVSTLENISSPVEMGCQRAIHAEANAIAYAARVGVGCEDALMYSTAEPCIKCAHLILAAGLDGVLYLAPYRLGVAGFLRDAGVPCDLIEEDL